MADPVEKIQEEITEVEADLASPDLSAAEKVDLKAELASLRAELREEREKDRAEVASLKASVDKIASTPIAPAPAPRVEPEPEPEPDVAPVKKRGSRVSTRWFGSVSDDEE